MSPFVKIMKDLMTKLSIDASIIPDANDNEIKDAIKLACDSLKNEKALIVFGWIENNETTTEPTAVMEFKRFEMMVQELIQNTSVKIVITAYQPLSCPDLEEQIFTLGPLNFDNTVKLFANMASTLPTWADHRQFVESLVTSKEEGQLQFGHNIPLRTKYIFEKLGRGIPFCILDMAKYMPSEEVQHLKEGTFKFE